MFRLPVLPYDHIEVVSSREVLTARSNQVSQGEIPALALSPELGKNALIETLETQGYTVGTENWGPSHPSYRFDGLMGSWGLIAKHRLHWDGQDEHDGLSLSRLHIHESDAPYIALFVTPRLDMQGSFELTDKEREKITHELWQGIVDEDLWETVHQHIWTQDTPVVFRSKGIKPVGHDFQPTAYMNRNISVQKAVKPLV